MSDDNIVDIQGAIEVARADAARRRSRELTIEAGDLPNIVSRVYAAMRAAGDIYKRAGELVFIGKDWRIHQVDPKYLKKYLPSIISFNKRNTKGELYNVDCSLGIAEAVHVSRFEFELPELRHIINHAVLTHDNRLLTERGFDADSGLFVNLSSKHKCEIPDAPTQEDIAAALDALWLPFVDFPFVTKTDEAVMLAALLTAVIRPVLPTAPAVLFDSPAAGSGKSLLSECIARIAGADEPYMLPVNAGGEEELKKALLSTLRAAPPVACIDNIMGRLVSSALCTLLTTRAYTDRILGQSVVETLPVSTMFVLNGNNIKLVGDLNRRVLRCRIDANIERPYSRKFALHPAVYVKKNRHKLVHAALVLLRAGCLYEGDVDGYASFDDWAAFVRAAVLVATGVDPVLSVETGYQLDPDHQKHAALLSAWYKEFGFNSPKRVAHVIAEAEKNVDSDLYEAVNEIARMGNLLDSRRFGHWLSDHADRIINGMKLSKDQIAKSYGGAIPWTLMKID